MFSYVLDENQKVLDNKKEQIPCPLALVFDSFINLRSFYKKIKNKK